MPHRGSRWDKVLKWYATPELGALLNDYFENIFQTWRRFLKSAMLTRKIRFRAEFFALQISGYSKAIRGFVRHSDQAAKLIWAASYALLEAGLLTCAMRLTANPT